MAVYTVYVPDFGRRTLLSDAEKYAALPDAVFVRAGFSRAAFFLGPLWLAWHRLWGFLILWFALFFLLAVEAPKFLGGGSIFWIALLLEFLLGLEGNSLRRGELARRGFQLSDVAIGRRTEAERTYFRRALTAIPPPAPAPKITDAPRLPGAPPPSNEVAGLFPHPGDAR